MDSIRQTLTDSPNSGKDNLINRIRLAMNADIARERVFVLVEGSDDKKFVQYILDGNVDSFESIGGKHILDELLAADELASERVIAIRDRDYSNPEDYPDRMFAYDHCALELMLLSHPQVKNRMEELCDDEKDKKDFPLPVMRHIAPFSILRQKNEQEHLTLPLDKGVLSGLQRNSKKLPDMHTLFQRLDVSEEMFDTCCQEAETLADDNLWDITNGHDICSVLARISRLGKNKLNEGGYRLFMLNIYRTEDFYSTKLCEKLLRYQHQHQLSILKKVSGGDPDAI